MLQQVGKTFFQRFQVLVIQLILGNAAVIFQCTYGSYDDDGRGSQSCHTAFDIQEFFCAQISAEAGLCDGVIAQLQSHLGSDNGIASMGDISERTAVYDSGHMLQSLNQVRFQSVFQKRAHSALSIQITGCDGSLLLAVSVGIPHDNAGQTFFQVIDISCKTQNRHDLGSDGDVVSVLAGCAVGFAAQTVYHVS